jgi:hypothetical protein
MERLFIPTQPHALLVKATIRATVVGDVSGTLAMTALLGLKGGGFAWLFVTPFLLIFGLICALLSMVLWLPMHALLCRTQLTSPYAYGLAGLAIGFLYGAFWIFSLFDISNPFLVGCCVGGVAGALAFRQALEWE